MKITDYIQRSFQRLRHLLPDRHWLALSGLLAAAAAVIADGLKEVEAQHG